VDRDEAGFEAWALARRGALARSAYLLTTDVHLAEDLVQETLTRVADHWRRAHRNPDAYARTVMHHLAVDRWRRLKVRPRELLTDQNPELGGTGGPDGTDVERRVLLRDALARLTPKQRAVLSLRFYDDLTEAQTAAVLRCSVSTVKSQTRTALERLRALAPELLASLAEEAT
jgi:RNA polymerase sigma-70 factor (sigma-E family)